MNSCRFWPCSSWHTPSDSLQISSVACASIRFENGAQVSDAQLSFTIPYLGKSEGSQKYSLGTTVFTQRQTNYYPVYLATPAPIP